MPLRSHVSDQRKTGAGRARLGRRRRRVVVRPSAVLLTYLDPGLTGPHFPTSSHAAA